MTRNLHLLRDDPDTRDIYELVRVLCAYRRDTNLCCSLVRRHLNNVTASDIVVRFHVVGHSAILAPTLMLHLGSTRLGDTSPSMLSTPL